LVYACSPQTGSADDTGSGSTGNGGKGGAKGSSGSPSSDDGGSTDPFGSGSILNPIGRDSGGPLSQDGACAASVLEPESIIVEEKVDEQIDCTSEEPEPIAIYIVLDNSGSMKDNNKWNDAVTAITAFVRSDTVINGKGWTCVDKNGDPVDAPSDLPPPGAGTVSIAIQYFHPQNVGGANECDGSGHRTPAVAMGLLPGNSDAIVNSLGQTGPNGNTPTVGALYGGVQYCQQFQASNPGIKCVNVLITDGQPNGCGLSSNCGLLSGQDCVDPNSVATLTPTAANGLTAGVITFTVGMQGVSTDGFNLLNQIAIAGGSDCTPSTAGNEACNVTSGGSQALLDAFNLIRSSVQVASSGTHTVTTQKTVSSTLPCEWSIPDPTDGREFDKGLVNVTFTTGGVTTDLYGVPTEAECAAAGGGWHYDDNDAPTRLLACPSTCTEIQAATDANVSVLFGCVTKRPRFQ